MNGLFDLILENSFFLIIIIGGIISLLKGKGEKPEEENNQPTNNQKPKRAESPFERSRQTERTRPTEKVVQEPISSQSIEELREAQMLRFTGKREANDRHLERDIPRIADSIGKAVVHENAAKNNKKAFKKDFNKNLTKQGLVNSVIMAEVLGAPRARSAYQTVITKRRNS